MQKLLVSKGNVHEYCPNDYFRAEKKFRKYFEQVLCKSCSYTNV